MRTAAPGDDAQEKNCIIHAKTMRAVQDDSAREKILCDQGGWISPDDKGLFLRQAGARKDETNVSARSGYRCLRAAGAGAPAGRPFRQPFCQPLGPKPKKVRKRSQRRLNQALGVSCT